MGYVHLCSLEPLYTGVDLTDQRQEEALPWVGRPAGGALGAWSLRPPAPFPPVAVGFQLCGSPR